MSTVVVVKGVIATNLLHGDHTTRWISEGKFVAAICRSHDTGACQAWTTSYQLTPFTAHLTLGCPGVGNRREKNESGGVESRRICKIKSSEYMSEYPTIYT
jgi:hypothetical protein